MLSSPSWAPQPPSSSLSSSWSLVVLTTNDTRTFSGYFDAGTSSHISHISEGCKVAQHVAHPWDYLPGGRRGCGRRCGRRGRGRWAGNLDRDGLVTMVVYWGLLYLVYLVSLVMPKVFRKGTINLIPVARGSANVSPIYPIYSQISQAYSLACKLLTIQTKQDEPPGIELLNHSDWVMTCMRSWLGLSIVE